MELEGGVPGIVVVFASFFIQFFSFGVTSTIGMYNIVFFEYFGASASEVSLIAALNYGVFLGSGPIVSFLMTKFNYRHIVLCGAALVVLGLLAVPLFPNLYTMYLTLGALVGFGSCCTYVPSHTLSGLFYHKYRSLATGIVTSGSGLGSAVIPVLTGLFIEAYGWKGSFIILAGLCLHLFVLGSLLRGVPKKSTTFEEEKNDDAFLLSNGNSTVEILLHESTDEKRKSTSDAVDAEEANYDPLLHKEGSQISPSRETKISKSKNAAADIEKKLPDTARHIYIFKDFNFVVYFISNYLWNASACMMEAFVPEYFRLQGNSILEVSWLIGVSGYGSCFGGIFGGFLGNIRGVNRIYLYISSCVLVGIFIILIPQGDSFAYFAGMMIVFGLSLGVILGLLVVVLADLVGVDSLGNGMGYLMLSNGLGTLTGPIIAGVLVDTTDSFEFCLLMSGIVAILSGACMCIIPLRQFFKRCRKVSEP